MEQRNSWRRLNGMMVQTPIREEVRQVLLTAQEQGHTMKVCIGTDSQVKGRCTKFATVIVFIRKGKGGFMYLRKEEIYRKMSIKERMLDEVARTVDTAYQLTDLFTAFNVDMEVHADINTNPAFKSNDALKEAMGYIMGMGFSFRMKPDAFASSSCANKVVQ
ncbi:ribonuclease H-like YkuK family protein [Chitinophaga horti]|uniref:Ribonuclease H-like YkuK family protein n=1 Tax=Chitinophaga horti TaxID=2920382 RepID=A0ABY6IZ09_9BACT|nr:ribonuclease H-like YkuK family protein [Chitinophaga horti]UYQ92633.1 ribonuclease H-like YkuK family protein [Chitinophaga horti]